MTRKVAGLLNPSLNLKVTGGFAPRNRRRIRAVRPLIALLSIAWVIAAAGCHAKDASPPTTGAAGAGPAAAHKPTAEQDAAKQRGEQRGAAIQAANQAATGAAPGGQ